MDTFKTPYEYYRNKRPENFSDTKVEYKATLKKEQFQYIMDRLSNDMKQDLFENLTKSLVSRFITPNIIPQTGPTGGGDGKTDLETYPVADEISERWYICDGGCHGSEKWAFAISTKEKWESKVKGDVKTIVETDRGFTKILFFSNRLISSKDSKDCEDYLSKKYNVPVKIFSQNWYVDKVFDQGCLDIAVKELNLSSEYCENTQEIGPRDRERNKRLKEVEEEILIRQSTTRLDTDLADLALEAAILSRNLELSPSVIRGRFKRAEDLADRYGTKQQLFQAIYQKGWTEFYWLETPDSTYEAFKKLKEMLSEEINVTRIERLMNLYFLITTAAGMRLFKTEIDIESEKRYIDSMHRYLKSDNNHQSSYLYMHIQWLEMHMIQNLNDEEMMNDLIDDLRKTLKIADHHIDIPLETNEEVLDMIGRIVKDNELYEELIDDLTEILSKRKQDITAAGIQMRRGEQNLDSGNYVQAIRHLGQCILLFGKEQTRSEYVRACSELGFAYINQDLLYAGKVMFMRSLSMLIHQLEIEGSADHLLITVLHEICMMELRSGQIVDFLNYYYIRGIMSNLNPDFQDSRLMEMIATEQNGLSIRIMSGDVRTNVYGLLPCILKRLDMVLPLDILYYKLGYHEQQSDGFNNMVKDNPQSINEIRNEIANDFFLFNTVIAQESVTVETLVNGCHITATSNNDLLLHSCSEMVLAYIESLLSTMDFKDIAFATDSIHFDVIEVKDGKTEIVKGQDSSHYVFNVNTNILDDQILWEALSLFISLLFSQNVLSRDVLQLFENKQTKERILDRLSVLMTYTSDVNNVIGSNYLGNIYAWREASDDTYTFKGTDDINQPFKDRKGKQANCAISSIIDITLWNQAKWKGCGYLKNRLFPSHQPVLLFCYKDITAGIKIFEGWLERFKQNQLNIRISFIMHIDRMHPTWYRVKVCQDILSMKEVIKNDKDILHVSQSARIHTMQPKTTENIDMFRREFELCKVCGITAVAMNDNNEMNLSDKNQRFGKLIPVQNIVFREAWEIGINDQDNVAILPNDDPIIPEEHMCDAPVWEVLQKRKNT